MEKYVLQTKIFTGETRYYNGTNSQIEVVRLTPDKHKALKFNTVAEAESEVIKMRKFCNFIITEVTE